MPKGLHRRSKEAKYMPEGSDLFKRLERSKVLKTKSLRADDAPDVARMIKLPKGAKPEYVKLTPYQEFCWRTMGRFTKDTMTISDELEENLLKAHMRLRPEEYLAVGVMTVILVFIATIITAIFLSIFVVALGLPFWLVIMIIVLLGILPTVMVYIFMVGMPGFLPGGKAKKRGKEIDKKLTSAMNFISAMSSADVPVDVIFKELSKQKIYGEIQKEAEWITRDTEVLGLDILTALRNAANRTPSIKFQEFLQGVVTTSTSGGQLKPYFLMKADQFEKEDKLEVKKLMETLGLLAETFVTVVVAFPLFLVVIIAIMALISKGGAGSTVVILYAVVGIMIPVSQFMFIFLIHNMSQEV
jgi:flagellar protein FlaJ